MRQVVRQCGILVFTLIIGATAVCAQDAAPTGPPGMGGAFRAAEQPAMGESFFHFSPQIDSRSARIPVESNDFSEDPVFHLTPYEANDEIWVYRGKMLNETQRPLIELGRPWYQLGQLPKPGSRLGFHNPTSQQFIVFGDFRMAAAANQNGDDSTSQLAWELNLNFNYQVTSTERFLFFISPLNRQTNTRYEFDTDRFFDEFDPNVNFGFFEGDLGAIWGGAIGETLPFDLPFAVGFMPMFAQNGIWVEDAVVGLAATIPARNNPRWGISNMDVTFLWAFDEISSPAFEGDDNAAKLYAVMTFIEAWGGYFEFDYGFLEDRSQLRDRSYHNIGAAFTRRYAGLISNSVRVLVNAGQNTNVGPGTADGTLLLIENSLITAHPSTCIPYFNLFAGFDRPQSVARSADSGGVLRNTGILFESDGMTGYPTLEPTANNTWGAAVGLNLLAGDLSQQLVLEGAFLQVMKGSADRQAIDDQYGIGMRYQRPLNHSWIFRSDAMYGWLRGTEDIHGVRVELRKKF